ncbi:MAG: Glutathione transport system permease protein GsiC [Syntrophomonadaceae bacterium]|nr:Glutathione transport system permease protein GsiC [Bacillota bacterium]
MRTYIVQRLLLSVPVIFGVSLLVFSIVRLLPGDPAIAVAGVHATPAYISQVREELGLDKGLHVQYYLFAANLLRGDLGTSTFYKRPVSAILLERFPRTLELTVAALLLAALLGVTAGIFSAVTRNSIIDGAAMLASLAGLAAPVFWLALMLQLFFAVHLGIFPSAGSGTIFHLILPSITLGAASAGLLARMTRSSMLEVLRQEYITTARAKGLSETIVIGKHALKNALIPVLTVLGLQFGSLLGGAVLTETIFAWPGVGRLLVDAILTRDYPVVQGTVLVLSVSFVGINLAVDILYAYLDPRIRFDVKGGAG